MPCWKHLSDSSIRGHRGYLWIQGHACTCVCDWLHFVLQANLCLPWITEISKSPLLFTQVPFQSPQPAKTKYFVQLGLSAFVLLVLTQIQAASQYAIYTVSSVTVAQVLTSTFPQVHTPKAYNVTCVKRNLALACRYKIAYISCVECSFGETHCCLH